MDYNSKSPTNHRTSEVASLSVDSLDCKLTRRFTNYKGKVQVGGGLRGRITKFSDQSRRRLIYSARNIPNLGSMLTVTYPHEDYAQFATGGNFMEEGETIKTHLRKFRQALTYRGIYGFWFLEFQARGAPHIHFFISGEVAPHVLQKLQKTWHKIVGSGCPHHLTRGIDCQVLRKKSAAASYASKYSSKSEQKIVPDRYRDVGRFWGLFGDHPQNNERVMYASMSEIYQMVRIARRHEKAMRRSLGLPKVHKDKGRGFGGCTLFSAGPCLKAYLEYHYTIPDSPRRTVLLLHDSNTCQSVLQASSNILRFRELLPLF